MKKKRKMLKKSRRTMIQQTGVNGTEGKMTKRESTRGGKNKKGSIRSRKTKKKSGKDKRISIFIINILVIVNMLVIINILICLLASFCFSQMSFHFNYLFLIQFFLFQILISFPRIFFFILIIFIDSNSFFNFGTVILVETGRSWIKCFVCVKFDIRILFFMGLISSIYIWRTRKIETVIIEIFSAFS